MNVKLPWYSQFSFSFFYLEKIVNKMKTISVTVIVMILKKSESESESDLISPMTGVLSQQVQDILTTVFERHLTVEDFTVMDQHMC